MSAVEKDLTNTTGGQTQTAKSTSSKRKPSTQKTKVSGSAPRKGTTSSQRRRTGVKGSSKKRVGYIGQTRRNAERAALISLGASHRARDVLRGGFDLDQYEKSGRKVWRDLEREISKAKGEATKQIDTRRKRFERLWVDNRKVGEIDLTSIEHSLNTVRETAGVQIKSATEVIRDRVKRAQQVVLR